MFEFVVVLLFLFVHRTNAVDENSKLRLTVYPSAGSSVENIQIRCEIFEPSVYDNVYLFVKTDNVKPAGILLMADPLGYDCRINENKRKHIQLHSCNSSMILINVNHEIIDDSLHTIEYACSQGENHVFNSYQITCKTTFRIFKSMIVCDLDKPIARYMDPLSTNSSSTLTHPLVLPILFLLLLLFARTIRR